MRDKQFSTRERKRRMFLKKFNSLRNKMVGKNEIWWESLSIKQRYSLVFKWDEYKKSQYPKSPKLKHFLGKYKSKYKVDISTVRQLTIDKILN